MQLKINRQSGILNRNKGAVSTGRAYAVREETRLIRRRRIVSFLYEKKEFSGRLRAEKRLLSGTNDNTEERIMGLWELFILAVGLAMDAFSVAVCKGLSVARIRKQHILVTGLYFGVFQALMPAIGYLLGTGFQKQIQTIDHWIAFILLSIIGVNMIRESRGEAENLNDSFTLKEMLPLAVATSIDALAVGVTFAFLKVQIVPAVSFIGVVTFVISCAGVVIGNRFGAKYKSKAELAGGIVLVCMGIKILVEHVFFS